MVMSPFNIGSILVKKKSTQSVAYMGRSFRGTQEAGRETVASKVHQFSEEKDTGGRRRWQQMTPCSMPKLPLWQPALRQKFRLQSDLLARLASISQAIYALQLANRKL
jgi:hypothetical protein